MKPIARLALALAGTAAAATASAHSGHGVGALAAGMAHLLTPEHLLPLLAALGLILAGGLAAAVLWRSPAGNSATVLRTWRWIAGAAAVGVLAAVLALPALI